MFDRKNEAFAREQQPKVYMLSKLELRVSIGSI